MPLSEINLRRITCCRPILGRSTGESEHPIESLRDDSSCSHENEEAILVLKGAWRFRMRGEEFTLRADQMFSIPGGAEHSGVALEDTLAVGMFVPRWRGWAAGEDRALHYDPDDYLRAV